MVVAVWSVKGGVGVSSVAALLAMGQVERAEDVLLVDLCGDIPALLGITDAVGGPGLAEWCAMQNPAAEALARLEVEARPGLRVLPRGAAEFLGDASVLMGVLAASHRTVIIDCGVILDCGAIASTTAFRRSVVSKAESSLLVARECYLNLRALQKSTVAPSGVVLLKEHGRFLGRVDVEQAAKAPVIAEVAVDSSVAGCIDSGLVVARVPRRLLRAMGKVLERAA